MKDYIIKNANLVSYPTFMPETFEYANISKKVQLSEATFIEKVVKVLSRYKRPIRFYARGYSMAVFSGIVLYQLRNLGKDVNMYIIRKPEDIAHECLFSEERKCPMNKKYVNVVIDDLISSGNSIINMCKCIDLGSNKLDYLFVIHYWDKPGLENLFKKVYHG